MYFMSLFCVGGCEQSSSTGLSTSSSSTAESRLEISLLPLSRSRPAPKQYGCSQCRQHRPAQECQLISSAHGREVYMCIRTECESGSFFFCLQEQKG